MTWATGPALLAAALSVVLSATSLMAQAGSARGVVITTRTRQHSRGGLPTDGSVSFMSITSQTGTRARVDKPGGDDGSSRATVTLYDAATRTLRSTALPGMVMRLRFDSLRPALERLGRFQFDLRWRDLGHGRNVDVARHVL
jgi:hypothetical protein